MESNPSQQVQDALRSSASAIGPEVTELKENIAELNGRLLRAVKERPGACLVGALALGFLVGRWVSR